MTRSDNAFSEVAMLSESACQDVWELCQARKRGACIEKLLVFRRLLVDPAGHDGKIFIHDLGDRVRRQGVLIVF